MVEGEKQEAPVEAVGDKEPIGRIVVTMNGDLSLSMHSNGVLDMPHFMDMVWKYLKRVTNARWQSQWQEPKEGGTE